ncbi:GerAB/ArcD/ProY family transporter [Cohnella nanjingensis]|uniref:Endospore germination permease n=1 Tax=Cohnella nanjingensis TaxID=1387779 RepID=A0A7X0RXC6_9BACL|nr:endospore germination permease [Cohnella nanjingensis]MBB6675392.1 endospore germination permease [Cohnella nanjingensis]
MSEEKLTMKQLGALTIFALIGDSIIILPSSVAGISRQDAWLSMLLVLLFGPAGCWLMLRLRRLNPSADLIQLLRAGFGRWAGGAVGLAFLYFLVLNTAAVTRELGDLLATQIMPETPIRATHLLFILVLVWGVRCGLPTIARAGEVLFPWFVLFMTALIVLLIPRIEVDRIRPIAAEGFPTILHGSIVAVVYPFAELIVFAMLWPAIRPAKKLARDFMLASLIGGIVMFLVVFISVLVLGPYLTAHQVYPTYALAKKISIGHFLERVEALLAISWMISLFFKGILYFYASLSGIARLFGLRESRALATPLATVVYGLAFAMAPNLVYFNDVGIHFWPYWDITFAYAIPLALLAALAIRGKKPSPAAR